LLTSVFHGLSSGNGRRSSVAPEPGAVPDWSAGVDLGSLAEEQAAIVRVIVRIRKRMMGSCRYIDDWRRDSRHADETTSKEFFLRRYVG
jgi:hypothetical protein